MRSFSIVLILAMLGLFVQGTLLKVILPENSVVPNLMVAAVAFFAFYGASTSGLLLSFLLGLLFDLGSGALVGPWAGAFVVVFLLISSMSQRLFVNSPFTAFIAVLVGATVAQVVYIALTLQFRSVEFDWVTTGVRLILEAIFSAFCAPICFAVFRWIRLVERPRMIS